MNPFVGQTQLFLEADWKVLAEFFQRGKLSKTVKHVKGTQSPL